MKFGEKLQQLRKSNGLSQEQLAEKVTVSRQAVSKWELGESIPDTDNIVQLSKLFGVTTDYLLNDDFESDLDLPAVKQNGESVRLAERNKMRSVLCAVFIGIGVLGILTMWICSSVVPARKMIEDPISGSYTSVDPGGSPILDENLLPLWTTIEVRGDLVAFLQTYHFEGLFILCCVLTLAGIILLLRKRIVKRTATSR
jgi:transcriptional regulator with XRE-family HTH domain